MSMMLTIDDRSENLGKADAQSPVIAPPDPPYFLHPETELRIKPIEK